MYKLSPSSLTFQWDECKYCFYMQVKHGIVLRGTFPGIFTRMGNLTSGFYHGQRSEEISPKLPPGVLSHREVWVQSAPIRVPGAKSQCYIRGRCDAAIAFDDGSYAIVDYKTSDADEDKSFYSRQLSAYAYALENPSPKALHLSPISRLGLFIITPEHFERNDSGDVMFVNRTKWIDIPRDDDAFLDLLRDVLAVLDSPAPPEPDPKCGTCTYRRAMEGFSSP